MSAADIYTYDEAENRAPQLLAVSWSILSVVILSIIGRFYSRRHLLRAIHIEDWLALLACVNLTVFVIIHTVMTTLSFGHHIWAIPSLTRRPLPLSASSRILYPPTIAFIRISVLLFMRRLCPHVCVHIAVAVLIALNILFAVISVLLMIGAPGTKCLVDDLSIALAIPITSTCIHILMYFVPVITVLRVSFLGWGQNCRISLFCLRIYTIPSSYNRPANVSQVWNASIVAQWTVYETGVSIILASTPALWALLSNTMKRCGTDWERASSAFPTRPVSMVTVPLGARRTARDSYEELFLGTGLDAEEPRGPGRV
ncbi:hypothetical protein BZA77DRAFT_319070 [Pyronema omphalodes]|nr:hypothetical protein BZA77DRAFT_319070 [Pyronema omphalodes]